MPAHLFQASFNGGELSRRLQSRVDSAIYPISASEITNMAATIEGPLVKRPGTRVRAAALATASWLSEFVFNATQAYAIEWSEEKLRFVTNDALLAIGGVPVEVEVPYTAAQAPSVSQEQVGDVLYLAAAGHPPATLSRTAADAFAYAALSLKGGPFKDQNRNEALVVSASGTTGTVTLTANAALFLPGHVGSPFRLEALDFSGVPAWEPGFDGIKIGVKRRSDGKVYLAASAGRTGSIQPTHGRGTEYDGTASGRDINDKAAGGIRWTYLYDRQGQGVITAVTGPTSARMTVERRLADSLSTAATHRWAIGAFSYAEGWPHLVFRWRGRLCFVKDFELFGSVAGGYRDFSEFNDAGQRTPDMAFRLTIDSTDPILWAKADRQLLLGSHLTEYMIGPQNPAEPISGANLTIIPQSFHGSNGAKPLQIGSQTIFVQRGGRKIRAGQYDFGKDRYVAPNMTIWARQITAGGIVQLAYQAEPEELLWALRGDGVAVTHANAPEQDVKGWSEGLAIEGAQILSMAAMPSTDGQRDDLWLLVQRGAARTIEQLAPWWDEDEGVAAQDAFYVDSGLSYTGAPATHFSGLDHLVGLDVIALADGAEVGPLTVAPDGSIDIPDPASKVHVGRAYTARVTTLRPEIAKRDGSSQGRRKKAVNLVARLIDSFGVMAGGFGERLDEMLGRDPATAMGSGPALYSGDTEQTAIQGGWNNDGRVTMENRTPFPWIVSAAQIGVEDGDT